MTPWHRVSPLVASYLFAPNPAVGGLRLGKVCHHRDAKIDGGPHVAPVDGERTRLAIEHVGHLGRNLVAGEHSMRHNCEEPKTPSCSASDEDSAAKRLSKPLS
jgi:hypothetical protein